MTVPATSRRAGPFTGNGVTTAFPFTFKVFTAADVAVTRAVGDISAPLVQGSDYNITLNPDQESAPGGSIVLITPLAVGAVLVAAGAVPYDQTTDFPAGGAYRAQTHENAFDRTVFQIQQLAELQSRAVKLNLAASADVQPELPLPEPSRVLGWNATGTALENLDPSILATIIAFGTANSDVFSGDGVAAAFTLSDSPGNLNNLDISIGGVTQTPGIDYAWSGGTTLTFTTAPPAGTNNILVRYMRGLPQAETSLPSQTGNAGRYLTTDGNNPAWAVPPSALGVNVFNFMTGGQIADVKAGTLLTDVTAAVQSAIDAAKAGAGGMVLFPRGQYRITAPLVLDYSAETADPVSGMINRLSLFGEGPGSSQLVATHGGALIDYRAGPVGTDGPHTAFAIRDLGLRNSVPRQAGSVGIKADNMALWEFQNIWLFGFELGLDFTDCLSGVWRGGRLWSGRRGMHFRYANFSRPNAITIQNVAIASNTQYAVLVENGALFNLIAGSIEGNGAESDGLADGDAGRLQCWGVKMVNSGVEGATGLTITGTYFEFNGGTADVWIEQTAETVSHSITGAGFLRFSSSRYTLNNVRVERSGGGVGTFAALHGCGFKSQAPYTATALRPYVSGNTATVYDFGSVFQNPTETDYAVFAPHQLPVTPSSILPTGARQGAIIYSDTVGNMLVRDGTGFRYPEDKGITVLSVDGSPSITVFTSRPTVLWTAAMTAARSLSISSVGAYQGARFVVRRFSAGPHALSIFGPSLITRLLAPGEWAEFVYDGSAWVLVRGQLPRTHVRTYHTTPQIRLQTNVMTVLVFETVEYDTLSEYNPATGAFTATEAGYYTVSGGYSTNSFSQSNGVQFNIRVRVNGVDKAIGDRNSRYETAVTSSDCNIVTTVYLNVGDVVTLCAFTNRVEDADQNLLTVANTASNFLTIDRIL